MNYTKNINQRSTPGNNESRDKVPKFGGL